MTNDNAVSVAIIGAGIIGINSAIELQERGYHVTVFDNRAIGEGCSKANAGHFATEQVFPLAELSLLWQLPKMLLSPLGPVAISPKYLPKALPWFIKFICNMVNKKRKQNTSALRTLNERAIASYKSLLSKANATDLFVQQGSLLVFENTPVEEIKRCQQTYVAENIAVDLLDKAQIKQLEPGLSDNINYALYFKNVAHTLNPLALSQSLFAYAQSLGVVFKQQDIKAINHFEQGTSVITQYETLCFDKIVVAAGAWSKKFTHALGYYLPLESERGYSLDLPKTTAATFNRPIASAERKFIITPMTHGLRLAGTVEFAGLTEKKNKKRIDMLYNNATHIINNMVKKEQIDAEGWLGFRPSLPDSLPVICKAPDHDNIVFAFGHQHLGLTLGAITGKLVGQILDGEKTEVDLSPFCISRFNH
ncbi:NAD(P)/FAD-dependent oxidoreductase [Thalassotalea sediminis]|uniref:NAD(P)/FAD-dependent oxidoreductase n=1 Tax=Thalassotalea sediminis TaxID=1759089 RepID=UPI002572555C|nr:FAD-dependent oxidoreductase [Thalassotalea sediminis]